MKNIKLSTPAEKFYHYKNVAAPVKKQGVNPPAHVPLMASLVEKPSLSGAFVENDPTVPGGPGEIVRIASRLVRAKGPEGKRVFRITAIMDQWAPFISGVYFGEGDCEQEDTAMALHSIIENKAELCRRAHIHYDPRDWVDVPLPRVVITDHREGASLVAEAFKIRVRGGSFYNPWAASLLEFALDVFGKAVRRAPHQGAEQILATEVIKWNRASIGREFWKPSHDERPVIDLVREGLAKARVTRTGQFSFDEELKFHPYINVLRVVPTGVRASARGVVLEFLPMVLGCVPTWLHRGHLLAHYDPRSTDWIWIIDPLTEAMVPCRLQQKEFAGMSWARASELQSRRNAGCIERDREVRDARREAPRKLNGDNQ